MCMPGMCSFSEVKVRGSNHNDLIRRLSMSARTLTMADALYDYLLSVNRPLPHLLARLRAETAQLPMARMQISVEQGRFMERVTQLIQAKKVLEVGVFTGYSAHHPPFGGHPVAQALPEEGSLIACDVSEEWTSIGRRYWQEAGDEDTVALRALNAKLRDDPRVALSVLPVGDGLTLALKRG